MKVHDIALAGIAQGMADRTLVGSYIALRGRAVMALRAGAVPAAAVHAQRIRGRKRRWMAWQALLDMVIAGGRVTVDMAA